MLIANPIYDSVFKYLMDDQRAAKLILAAITGFDIEEVELRPTEVRLDKAEGRGFTVYRLDFAARVRTTGGTRLVLIEIQKAKFPTDIMRFRRYLGTQYASSENCQELRDEASGRTRKVAEPIFSIYLLGHRLEHTTAPVIRVARTCCDAATGLPLEQPEEFIEGLTHDSVVIQIPELKARRRNRLEMLLGIFDQDLADKADPHSLLIDEKVIPEEFAYIVRKLLEALAEKDVRQKMTIEDEILSELELRDRTIADWAEKTAEERKQKEEAQRREDEERRQKDVMIKALVAKGMTEAEVRKMLAP